MFMMMWGVGIAFAVTELVMTAMTSRPKQNRAFCGRAASDAQGNLNRGGAFEAAMGKKPMKSQRDAHDADAVHHHR
jgi:hypothetical protein